MLSSACIVTPSSSTGNFSYVQEHPMTSDFVRNIHLQTGRRMLANGASMEALASHFDRVGFNEREIAVLLAEFGDFGPKLPDQEFVSHPPQR
jgi:hypothetical protein